MNMITKTASSSETSVHIYQTTSRLVQEHNSCVCLLNWKFFTTCVFALFLYRVQFILAKHPKEPSRANNLDL